MLNCEKAYLICYIEIGDMPNVKAMQMLNQFKEVLDKKLTNKDDSLEYLIVPVRNQGTKIELLNARYPKIEYVQKEIEDIAEELPELGIKTK